MSIDNNNLPSEEINLASISSLEPSELDGSVKDDSLLSINTGI